MGDMLKEFLAGTGLIDLVIGVFVLEFLFLEGWLRKTERQRMLSALRPTLVSGLWLMLALRSVLTGEHALLTAGFLTAAGLTHLVDLRQRLQRPDS